MYFSFHQKCYLLFSLYFNIIQQIKTSYFNRYKSQNNYSSVNECSKQLFNRYATLLAENVFNSYSKIRNVYYTYFLSKVMIKTVSLMFCYINYILWNKGVIFRMWIAKNYICFFFYITETFNRQDKWVN